MELSNQIKINSIVCRLLLVLAVVDSIHLVSSFLTFSLPRLSLQYCRTSYQHIVPVTLPLAQVRGLMSFISPTRNHT